MKPSVSPLNTWVTWLGEKKHYLGASEGWDVSSWVTSRRHKNRLLLYPKAGFGDCLFWIIQIVPGMGWGRTTQQRLGASTQISLSLCVDISFQNMLVSEEGKCGEREAGDGAFSCALLSLSASGGWYLTLWSITAASWAFLLLGMRFLWRELSVEVRLVFILRCPSVCRAGLSWAHHNQLSLPIPSLLALSSCQAALTSLTPLQKELMNSDCLDVLQSRLSRFCTFVVWQIWLHTSCQVCSPALSALFCLTNGHVMGLWPAAGAPYAAPAAAVHHSQSPCQRSPVPFPQRTPGS